MMRSAVNLLSQRDTGLAKTVTAVIWAACAYGRLGEASFVEFMVALRGVLEQGPSVTTRLKGDNHLATVLRQASQAPCYWSVPRAWFLISAAVFATPCAGDVQPGP
jgi:hypothetical protein